VLLVSGSEGGVPAPGRDGARATTGRRCLRYTRRARIGICGMDQDWSTGEKRTDGISRPAKRKKSADGSCRQQSRTPVYNSGTKVASRHRGLKAIFFSAPSPRTSQSPRCRSSVAVSPSAAVSNIPHRRVLWFITNKLLSPKIFQFSLARTARTYPGATLGRRRLTRVGRRQQVAADERKGGKKAAIR